MLKTGISAVDMAGAKKNLEKEIPHWNFAQTRAAAEKEWENELKIILAEGGTEKQKTNFYTALYHTFLHPEYL
ncbi:MAG: glycoside hydrolase family 92 protein [Bacteroidales bacterium]|nr:glycoside hydrolase family 92 protein [Bacteroidales bacterium]